MAIFCTCDLLLLNLGIAPYESHSVMFAFLRPARLPLHVPTIYALLQE